MHIMHQGGLFIDGLGELGEPTLWVVDCRWKSSAVEEKAWAFQDYEKTMKMIGRWMKACARWILVLLCPKGENMWSLVRNLKTLDRTIHHSAWEFIPETSIQKRTITFDKHDVLSLEEIGNIIFVMVYSGASNPIENIRSGCRTVSCIFSNHTSKYPTAQWDKKQRTPEEMVRLINAYLPNE